MSNGELDNKRALYSAIRTAGGYGDDVDATGALYKHVPCLEVSDVKEGPELLPTMYQDGEAHGTSKPTKGGDSWEITAKVPLVGFLTRGGDGAVPPAQDWFDHWLTHQFTAPIEEVGSDAAAGGTTGIINLTAPGTGGLQSLHPMFEALIPGGAASARTQIGLAQNASATAINVLPLLAQAYTAAAIRAATRTWLLSDLGGNDLAFVHLWDGIERTLLGGRITSNKWKITSRQTAFAEVTIQGDSVRTPGDAFGTTAKVGASLPAIVKNTHPHVVGLKSPVWVNGTNTGTVDVEIDWGISAAADPSTAGPNGRARFPQTACMPKVTLTPTWSTTIRDLRRNVTEGPVLIQIGSGAYDGTRCNGLAVHFAEMWPENADGKGINNLHYHNLVLNMGKPGLFLASGVAARKVQVIRY